MNKRNVELIYGSKTKWFLNRKEKLVNAFIDTFNEKPERFFSSPGRAEILGNHTDHNNGKVIVSSVDLDIFACVKKNNDNTIRLKSDGYGMIVIKLDDLEPKASERGTSSALVRGVSLKIKEGGFKIGGFNAYCDSNIFKGSGLSSSAAFEVLIAIILNNLYNDGKISQTFMAQAGQYAENIYYGKPSGLLDEMGVSIGGFNYIDFKDTEKPFVYNFNFFLKNYRVVLVNTGGSHGNLTSFYSSIRDDMEDVAHFFGKKNLREVDENLFLSSIPELRKKVGGRAILRSIHYFDENRRVDKAFEALKENDIDTFLEMVNKSGESSYRLLENCFVQKDRKQNIALAIEVARRNMIDGAVRVHGGGFKGSIISYINIREQISYIDNLKKVFGERNVVKLQLRPVGAIEVIE